MTAVVRHRATVRELHALDPFAGTDVAEPAVWWCDPTDSAIVLGSRQSPELLDAAACARGGWSIVGRRSGGGAVLVARDEVVWIDVVLPPDVAPADIRASMVWIGECWADALADRVAGRISVHRGGMVCTPWSNLVCFAGIGPGEVLVGRRKLVGLSQRRTRRGIRIQGLVHRASTVSSVRTLFVGDVPDAPLDEPAVVPGLDARAVARRLADAVTESIAAR